MSRHSASFSISGFNTAGSALLNLKASSTVPVTLVEVGIFYAVLSTNAMQLGLVRMNVAGTATITSTAGMAHTTGATSTAVLETGWGTRPSMTGTIGRQMTLPLTIGAGIVWPMQDGGIIVPVSGGLCLQTINASGATAGTINGWFTWEE
jgi:hypothetical protein